MNETPLVSIIMLGYGGWGQYSEPAIKSLLRNTAKIPFELIFVDNKSPDFTAHEVQLIAKKDSRVVPILLTENLGFSGGNIEGFKMARGKYVVFINNDVLFNDENWLVKLVDEKAKNPNLVLGQQLITNNLWSAYRNICQPYMGGWLVFASKEDFEKVGPWDINFGKGFFEDTWMSVQFTDLGYELKEIPLGVEHLGSKTVSKMNPDVLTTYAQKVYKNYHIMREKGTKLRIVFLYYKCYPFYDADYEGKGIGGSEGSLVQLARELAKEGHVVEVFNDTPVEGKFNGVFWNDIDSYDPDLYADVLVLYRNIHPAIKVANARTKIFWSCDQYTNGDWTTEVFPYVDKVITISPFHMQHTIRYWGADPKLVVSLDMGIKYEDYIEEGTKIKNKLIFCSVPERGLKYMPEAFKMIKEQVPDATLVVTSDYTLWGAKPLNEVFKGALDGHPGVEFLGKISREELVRHQKEAEIMAYPCDYDENFCISAAECMATGAVPVTTRHGALPTTVGKEGVIMRNIETDQSFIKEFVLEVVSLLKEPRRMEILREKGRRRALKDFSWRFLVKKYLKLFEECLEKKEVLDMHSCPVCKRTYKTSFEMFKHRSEKHGISVDIKQGETPTRFLIKTTRRVSVSIGPHFWEGTQIEVPKEMAAEVIRIISEGYEPGTIEYESLVMSK